ncbi:hypothetical protein THRCLA_02252 [Thraustotheca clavata]|uniref:GTP-binding protein Era n=1 Tax=Thraustotheca clavata TaxID=74557 RepID=A0A1W0A627_9STRA|nr:hypothetical protein THRCLA_02252 [Thraustotheca clavata]
MLRWSQVPRLPTWSLRAMATFSKEESIPKWKKDREEKFKRARFAKDDKAPSKRNYAKKPVQNKPKGFKPPGQLTMAQRDAQLEEEWAQMRTRRAKPVVMPPAPEEISSPEPKKESFKVKVKAKRQKNKENRVFPGLEAPTSDVMDASVHYKEPDSPESGARSLSVAVIGRPNAGKSSLMNSILGFNVSAVSAKYNTTRDRVLGILTEDDVQITFFDTPGLVNKKDHHKYVRSLAITAAETMSSVDLSLLVVDAVKRLDDEALQALKDIAISSAQVSAPIALVMNKMDLVGPSEKPYVAKRVEALSKMIEEAYEAHYNPMPDFPEFEDEDETDEEDFEDFEDFDDFDDDEIPTLNPLRLDPKAYLYDNAFKVSALKESGVKKLRNELLNLAVDRPWMYHSSIKSDRSDLDLVTEIIREKIYRRFNQELPYQIEQENRGWTPFTDKSVRIDQDLIVPSDRHKRILIGKNGDTLRSIGTSARLDIQKLLGCPVHLYLNVRSK